MPQQPTKLPQWATTGGTTVEPSAGEKASGWVVEQKPPARKMNWLLNLIYQWTQYLQAPVGTGAAAGVDATGGSTSGPGLKGTGGAPNGIGVQAIGAGTGAGVYGDGGASDGPGVRGVGGATNGRGGNFLGVGSGYGVIGTGGATDAAGVRGIGGGTNGGGGLFSGKGTGSAITATAEGTVNAIGANCTGGLAGSGINATGGAADGTGVRGFGGATNGTGVYGTGTGTGIGVKGESSGSSVGGHFTGGGAGEGAYAKGGATDAAGLKAEGGGTNGRGVWGIGFGTGKGGVFQGGGTAANGVESTGGAGSGAGVYGIGGTPNGPGVRGLGDGVDAGVKGIGGDASGWGGDFSGGASNGGGVKAVAQGSGIGLDATATGGYGVKAQSGTVTPAKAALRIVPQAVAPSSSPAKGDVYIHTDGGKINHHNGAEWDRYIPQSYAGTNSPTVQNGVTTEQDIPTDQYTIPADTLRAGSTIRIRAKFDITDDTDAGNITFRLKVGSTTVASSITRAINDLEYCVIDTIITIYAAGASVFFDSAGVSGFSQPNTDGVFNVIHEDGTAINTTIANIVKATVQYSNGGGNNDMTMFSFVVSVL